MTDVSVIIPALNEPYLQQTIDSLLGAAKGEVEVIVVLDGYWPDPIIQDNPRVVLIHNSKSRGMRASINAAARVANGKYLMKCDAHCLFDAGYDVKLIQDCEPDWTMVPVRYKLDVDKWERIKGKLYEFEYIERDTLKGRKWPEYASRVYGQKLVDLMTSQGSCWFMHRERFWELGGLDEVNYGGMGREAQEVCLKTWLSGGRYVLNRNTWYAHWSKRKPTFKFNKKEKQKSVDFAVDYWIGDKWADAKHSLQWLVDKFSPVPTWGDEMVKEADAIKVERPRAWLEKHYTLENSDNATKVVGMTRNDIYKLWGYLRFRAGAEIGVWYAYNAAAIMDNVPEVVLYMVDPYTNHQHIRKRRSGDSLERARRTGHRRMRRRDGAIWIEMLSEDAHRLIPNLSLDFVYIDGEHTYDMAMLDIILWNRKVRSGGIVAGHDYYNSPKQYVGVQSAVNDYTRHHNLSFYVTDKQSEENLKRAMASWFWVKP